MKAEHNLSNNSVCVVCDEDKTQLFEIADCGHTFCGSCCISYISSQAENFAKAKCLQEGCNAELNKNKPIYQQLDAPTINRIQNYKLFQYLQGNKDAVGCKKSDCKGYFLKSANKGICSICESTHCLNCFELSHAGACASNQKQQEQLRKLNYRKCPKCSIWVEKIAGCEFINCKCGIQFCYKCGEEYSKDPCRKRDVWRKQSQIRRLMKKLQLSMPSDIPSLFLFIFRILMMIIIVVPFTMLYCAVPLILGIAIVEVLVFLFMPLVLFYALSTTQDCNCRGFGYFALVLFYPVIGAFFALVAFIIILVYPCTRNKYHHGIYDPLDTALSYMTAFYLKFVNMVIMCCCT